MAAGEISQRGDCNQRCNESIVYPVSLCVCVCVCLCVPSMCLFTCHVNNVQEKISEASTDERKQNLK